MTLHTIFSIVAWGGGLRTRSSLSSPIGRFVTITSHYEKRVSKLGKAIHDACYLLVKPYARDVEPSTALSALEVTN